jgi:predicted esterase
MSQQELEFNYRARYFKLGDISDQTKAIWFVLHGYGQLAEYFIQKFQVLSKHGICVIAPEGLSRFYLEDVTKRSQGGSNRVGATWMTRENRLMDIDNYLRYLNQVYMTEVPTRIAIPASILGFSQGAATASRWAIENKVTFHRLILWAGLFPDDMDFDAAHQVLINKNVQLVYGTQDPFLTDERLVHLENLRQKLKVPATVLTFEGKHEIDESALLKLI